MLSQQERDLAVYRLEREAGATEAHGDTTAMQGLKLALTDLKVYALVFCMLMTQGMGTVTSFFPTIVESLGYDKEKTLLLTSPPYLFACVVFMAVSWYSDVRFSRVDGDRRPTDPSERTRSSTPSSSASLSPLCHSLSPLPRSTSVHDTSP